MRRTRCGYDGYPIIYSRWMGTEWDVSDRLELPSMCHYAEWIESVNALAVRDNSVKD